MQKSYHLYFLKEKNDSFKKIVYLRGELKKDATNTVIKKCIFAR